jgi:hypothetical protein
MAKMFKHDVPVAKSKLDTAQPLQGVKRVRELTSNLISLAFRPGIVVKFTGEMYEAEMPAVSRNESGKLWVADVVDLETGEAGQLLLPAVLIGVLRRQPVSYVGKTFEILTGDIVPGKQYRQVKVYEVEV